MPEYRFFENIRDREPHEGAGRRQVGHELREAGRQRATGGRWETGSKPQGGAGGRQTVGDEPWEGAGRRQAGGKPQEGAVGVSHGRGVGGQQTA